MMRDITISGKLLKKIGSTLLCVAIGAALGVSGLLFVQNYNPPDEEPDNVSVVLQRVMDRGELVSVSQNYSIVEKSGNSARLFDIIDIPFTDNSFWYRYNGTIKAGVNLENIESEDIANGVKLSLDQPYIISNSPDMQTSGVLEERNNALNPIKISDIDKFQADCVSRGEQDAINNGLLDEAREQAEARLTELFQTALGSSFTVQFDWRSAEAQE